jgi:hypothetical protein
MITALALPKLLQITQLVAAFTKKSTDFSYIKTESNIMSNQLLKLGYKVAPMLPIIFACLNQTDSSQPQPMDHHLLSVANSIL